MSESMHEEKVDEAELPVEPAGTSSEPPEPSPPSEEPNGLETARLQKAIRIAVIALGVLVIGFGVYYYVDRYVATGDRSPLEMTVEELENAVRADPDDPDTRLALAEVYIARTRYREALAQAGQVLEAYPDNERALLVLGIAHEASNQPEAAIAVLESFVDLRKDTEMAHVDTTLEAAYFFLGRAYLAADRPQEAADALDAALKISPTDADALHQAGMARQALGDHEQALGYFERATTFVPDFTEVYLAMADSYGGLNQPDRQRYARAMQLYSTREFQAALPELLAVTAALPDFAPGYLGLALTLEQLGDLQAGIEAAQQALTLEPNYLAAEQTLGRLVQQQGGGG